MIVTLEQLPDGTWRMTGFPGIVGVGKTEAAARRDFNRKLKAHLDEQERLTGHRLRIL